ncbi:MAG: cupredoxin domain-containing protein [Candidatus Limnocylindrales bacterium]
MRRLSLGWVGLALVLSGAVVLALGVAVDPASAPTWRGGNGTDVGPGAQGFVAGTVASPRTIGVIAGPGYAFRPSTITVARGETITFLVTTMGPTVHEFMVGPADAVAADQAGTPEIADIGMMASKSLTYTFDGPGPFAFACHAEGHYEAGMRGDVIVVG